MRGLSRVLVAALVATAVAAPAGTAAGQPQAGGSEGGGTAPPPGADVVSRHTVTLLTGDVVEVATLADGRQVASARRSTADGPASGLQVRQVGSDLYVLPDDAVPYVQAGTLDRELFNVTDLVEQGYDDAHRRSLPLLVSYGSPARFQTHRTQTPPTGARRTAELRPINGAAWEEDKGHARAFWNALRGAQQPTATPSPTLAGGATRVWLSRRVHVSLAESVPQVGAPQAWAAGYDGRGVKVAVLDTGADLSHPDLAGRVAASESFVPGQTVADGHGHGTHVAATVAGSGAASGGSRKGVAPGAELLVGKVLDNGGSGQDSWIISGMQWAVDQGARVVSMSLGGAPSDGTDPLSMAVDNLSASSRTLFVIAAGNLQGGEPTSQNIASPGAANSALTVGAVSKTEVLADFSHVGPRMNDYAIKPEITAPGVNIVAARAAGTSLGTPVDDLYTSLNGTSMATPHVAGAAAILAQEHPDWTGQQIKEQLVATARTSADYSVYQQGGGRLDVARAYSQQVRSAPATLNLGFFRWPHDGSHPGVTRTVTYTNDSAAEVTLDLSVSLKQPDGTAAPDGMARLGVDRVTVPAGGSATVDLAVDPNPGAVGSFSGYVVASTQDGSVLLHTPFGLTKEAEIYTVSLHGVARDGSPANRADVLLWSLDRDEFAEVRLRDGQAAFRLRPGRYFLVTEIPTFDEGGASTEYTSVVQPTLSVTGDTDLTLDARKGVPVTVSTPKPTEIADLVVKYSRVSGSVNASYFHQNGPYLRNLYAVPTEQVDDGVFEYSTQWDLREPALLMRVRGHGSPSVDYELLGGAPRLDGKVTLPVVDAGDGSAEALARVDARGALALMTRTDDLSFTQQAVNAAQAGAKFVVIYNYEPGWWATVGPPKPIPGVTVTQADGQALLAMLARGPLSIELRGTAVSPYVYDLMMPELGRIPDRMSYVVGQNHMVAEVDNDYYSQDGGHLTQEAIVPWRPWMSGPFFLNFRDVPTPLHQTQWVSANGDGTTWRHFGRLVADGPWLTDEDASYQAGQKVHRTWGKQVVRPGIPDRTSPQGQPSYRQGDTFQMTVWPFLDADSNHYGELSGGFDFADASAAEFSRDGELVLRKTQARGAFPAAPEGDHTYRLALAVTRQAEWWQMSTRTDTAWTFHSQRPADGQRELLPLLQVDYDLPLDGTNTAPGHPATLRLNAHHQQQVSGPDIAGMTLDVSYDDGRTWTSVPLVAAGGGEFTTTLRQPAAAGTSGYASLRVAAWDAAGNRIDQTITRAYRLAGA